MTGTLYGHVSLLWKMRSRLVWRATTRELYFYIKKPRYKIVSRFPKRRLHIFPGSRPPGIVCARELNFCVRDGNRWILSAITTAYVSRF